MDRAAHAVLRADLSERWAEVVQVCDLIEARRATFGANDEGVEAMGYQLHNLYGACEQLMAVVAACFENHVSNERYHTDLLRRMKVEIAEIRPALLSPEAFGLLDELRRFRHLFRHAYGVRLHGGRLADLADKAARLRRVLDRDRQTFLRALAS